MPNRIKTDLTFPDALGIVDQLELVGHQLEVDVTDGLINFADLQGKQHSLMVDFSNHADVKVTSHIGNDIIEHPTLRAGVNTFVANVIDKKSKGMI